MASASSSPTQTLPGESLPENANETTHYKDGSGAYKEPGSSVLWVDWDGPEDTLNPRK